MSKVELTAERGKSPDGAVRMPNQGDGRYELVERGGRVSATPDSWSQYMYFLLAPVLRELSCALSISRNVKRSNIYNAKRGLMFKSWTLTWTDLVMSNLSIQNH